MPTVAKPAIRAGCARHRSIKPATIAVLLILLLHLALARLTWLDISIEPRYKLLLTDTHKAVLTITFGPSLEAPFSMVYGVLGTFDIYFPPSWQPVLETLDLSSCHFASALGDSLFDHVFSVDPEAGRLRLGGKSHGFPIMHLQAQCRSMMFPLVNAGSPLTNWTDIMQNGGDVLRTLYKDIRLVHSIPDETFVLELGYTGPPEPLILNAFNLEPAVSIYDENVNDPLHWTMEVPPLMQPPNAANNWKWMGFELRVPRPLLHLYADMSISYAVPPSSDPVPLPSPSGNFVGGRFNDSKIDYVRSIKSFKLADGLTGTYHFFFENHKIVPGYFPDYEFSITLDAYNGIAQDFYNVPPMGKLSPLNPGVNGLLRIPAYELVLEPHDLVYVSTSTTWHLQVKNIQAGPKGYKLQGEHMIVIAPLTEAATYFDLTQVTNVISHLGDATVTRYEVDEGQNTLRIYSMRVPLMEKNDYVYELETGVTVSFLISGVHLGASAPYESRLQSEVFDSTGIELYHLPSNQKIVSFAPSTLARLYSMSYDMAHPEHPPLAVPAFAGATAKFYMKFRYYTTYAPGSDATWTIEMPDARLPGSALAPSLDVVDDSIHVDGNVYRFNAALPDEESPVNVVTFSGYYPKQGGRVPSPSIQICIRDESRMISPRLPLDPKSSVAPHAHSYPPEFPLKAFNPTLSSSLMSI